jgi:hypothetical protein
VHAILGSVVAITNRELALINCLDVKFPATIRLLCTWYINKNILANYRKRFPADKQDDFTEPNPE